MTASVATDSENEKAPGTQEGVREQSEIDRLMKQIEELRTQMAKLTVPENSGSIADLDPTSVHAPLEQKEAEVHDSATDLAIPLLTEAPVASQVEDLLAEEEFRALIADAPAQSMALTDALASALTDALTDVQSEVEPEVQPDGVLVVPSLVTAEATLISENSIEALEISDLFKEIVGGEDSLLAETLANLSNHSHSSLISESKSPEISEAGSELLESEPLLASVLNPVPVKADDAVHGIVKMSDFRKIPEEGLIQQAKSSDNVLSMTVSGQTSLKLKFDYEGEEILVHFSTDMIHIQFSEGSEFKIPVKHGRLKKVA